MNFKKFVGNSGIVLILLLVSLSCQSEHENPEEYKREINKWHNQRIQNLKKGNSWLSLAGLYWLEEGQNSFGSDSANDIVFPPKAPSSIGTFRVKDGSISVSVKPDISVTHNNKRVSSMPLNPDVSSDPTVLRHKSLSWLIIKRSNRYAVRLKDSENPLIENFSGIERFPVREKWRIKATVQFNNMNHTMNIPTITGKPARMNIPGTLTFSMEGKEYSLVLMQGNDSEFFVIFGDQTNGEATYGGGRYLYVDKPNQGNTTYIDFNKAYNPPCVFNDYATCPLPPPQNNLQAAVKAGEKMYRPSH